MLIFNIIVMSLVLRKHSANAVFWPPVSVGTRQVLNSTANYEKNEKVQEATRATKLNSRHFFLKIKKMAAVQGCS